MNTTRLTGNAKQKRDEAVRKFAYKYPHYTHKEIGFKFGLERSVVSRILNNKEETEALKGKEK